MRKQVNKTESLDSVECQPNQVVSSKAERIQKDNNSPKTDSRGAENQELLDECETDIEANLQGTFVLGWRLEQIRDEKLYHPTYKTFTAYCADRWDFSKTHANRLIQAYLCEKHLKSIANVEVFIPTKESQVRCICDLKPEQQVQVASAVKVAVGDKRAGVVDFAAARERLFPKPKREAKTLKETNDAPGNAEPSSKLEQVKFDTKLVSDPESKKHGAVQFDTNLVSLAELKKRADHIYNIVADRQKTQEVLNLVGKLKLDLAAWANWQATEMNKEAA